MPSHRKPAYYYSGVTAVTDDAVFFSGGIIAAPESISSVILARFRDGWGRHNVQNDFIVSIDYDATCDRVIFLGKNGTTKEIRGEGRDWTLENIKGRFISSKIGNNQLPGPMAAIKTIGGSTYSCGWNNQVYTFDGSAWHRILGSDFDVKSHFLTICGTSPNDVLFAGMNGVIAHYDGSNLRRVDSPTNAHLFGSAELADGTAALVGAAGTILLGDESALEFIDSGIAPDSNLWDAVQFNGELYMSASNNSMLRLSGTTVESIEINAKQRITTYRLANDTKRLWSVGPNHIYTFDGKKWDDIDCPENY